jgi:hypothetical protein
LRFDKEGVEKVSNFSIRKPYLILCEGNHDRAFFQEMVNKRTDVPKDYEPADPKYLGFLSGGNSRWGSCLDALVATSGFDALKGLIIAADNDNKPTESFNNILNALKNAAKWPGPPAGRYAVPAAPWQIEKGPPAIAVMMLPRRRMRGSLDTLCVKAAQIHISKATMQCVESYSKCAKFATLPASKEAKAKLRALIACYHRKDPELPFRDIWDECPSLIPVTNSLFDQIAKFLKKFVKENP